ncbi:MAG: TetR/AcrR family transcriptional regulator [Hyphomicrobiales bacterium]
MPARIHNPDQLIAQLGEVFREHGFDGASMAAITAATGLGKGSLYHAFPGGKDEMATAVLADIERWFQDEVFGPLGNPELAPALALGRMLDACETYFEGGGRVCLVGAFALGETRDRFHGAVSSYFGNWRDALSSALGRAGLAEADAIALAEEAISRIQGSLVLARALGDPACFRRELARLRAALGAV